MRSLCRDGIGMMYLERTSFQAAGKSTECGSRSPEVTVCWQCRQRALKTSSTVAPACRYSHTRARAHTHTVRYISQLPSSLIALTRPGRRQLEISGRARFYAISIRFSTRRQKLFRCASVDGNRPNWVDFRCGRARAMPTQEVVARDSLLWCVGGRRATSRPDGHRDRRRETSSGDNDDSDGETDGRTWLATSSSDFPTRLAGGATPGRAL